MKAIERDFAKLLKSRQRELLANVCNNMIENEAWENIAMLLVEQLGYGDTINILKDETKNIK